MKKAEGDDKVVYLIVPKRLIVAWIASLCGVIGLMLGVVVWSNYQWCGIIAAFNDTYQISPPTSETGQLLQKEFKELKNKFLCR